MIRGGAIRTIGYAVTVVLGAATSVFLLRGLDVDEIDSSHGYVNLCRRRDG